MSQSIVIDLNVLLDFLLERSGCAQAEMVLNYCCLKKIKGFVCAHEITTLAYFLQRELKSRIKIREIIANLLEMLEVIEVNTEILRKALVSPIPDYEDAVIEASAKTRKVDYIVTRDLNDFKHSAVKALTPEKMLAVLRD
ncbi:MAG: PIN domain-containing protein [Candidatus Margulisbacteria bacterium]|jgi:predicted nucleic acid-binding protein|nr:PIN domain-containing protein [Candidatus Margulisiibacteriota bacterium]